MQEVCSSSSPVPTRNPFYKGFFCLIYDRIQSIETKININKGISYENFSKPTHFLLIFDAVYASQLRSRRDRRTYRYSQ